MDQRSGSRAEPAEPIRWAVVVLVILYAIRVGLKILKEMGIYGWAPSLVGG